ncbi:hypothetical protein ACOMHN_064498 [Nucella lapillus]
MSTPKSCCKFELPHMFGQSLPTSRRQVAALIRSLQFFRVSGPGVPSIRERRPLLPSTAFTAAHGSSILSEQEEEKEKEEEEKEAEEEVEKKKKKRKKKEEEEEEEEEEEAEEDEEEKKKK